MEASKQTKELHIAMLPSPGMGHLIPFTELAKRLINLHNFTITFIIPTDGSSVEPQTKFLETLPNGAVNSMFLPPVNVDDLPEDAKLDTRISISMVRSLQALRDTLKVLNESSAIAALVVDHFGVLAFDVAKEFDIPSYIFCTTNSMVLTLFLHMPMLDESFTCEYRDLPEPVKLPGCVALHGKDLVSPVQDRKDDAYKWFLEVCKKINLADGIMVNSFLDLEPGAFKALMEGGWCKPPVYPVGPLIQSDSTSGKSGSECLKWLDGQPNGSVLFVSFGSGGTLSHEQFNELAFGLEMSGQRFLWVVKSPHDHDPNAAYFKVTSSDDPLNFLPKGFLDRIKDRGLLVPSWAPQIQVLSHESTGGFLSHCGWNSTLESIVHCVPLIAWPLYAEQTMNAVLLGDDLKVGLKVEKDENGLVRREQISKLAKSLIEGEEGKQLRNKMRELKDAAVKALNVDKGSSTKSLAVVAQKWKNGAKKN